MYLVDTNIFLEILLAQDRKEDCKRFLDAHIEKIAISDFSLHSIGVILFRNHEGETFLKFAQDTLPNVSILTLSKAGYHNIPQTIQQFHLDFDDAYQYEVASEHNAIIVTMDNDFEKVQQVATVNFL